MKKINTLKSSVTIAIQKKISCMPKKDLSIPIGTLTGTEILNGKGPDVPMKISLSGSVLTNFRSVFESAGINQTKHQIYFCQSQSALRFWVELTFKKKQMY